MIDLHRKTVEVMERYPEVSGNCLYDHEGYEDPNAHWLGEGLNVSHRPINNTTAFCIALLILSAVGWIFAR